MTTLHHTLYSVGYLNPGALDLLQERVNRGAVILDIRRSQPRVIARIFRVNVSVPALERPISARPIWAMKTTISLVRRSS